MPLTLNQILTRIETIVLAHKQIRTYLRRGNLPDFSADQTIKYPAVFLLASTGIISTSGHAATIAFKMFFLDLVNVSEDTKSNEQDVISDMLSVAMDIVAELNFPGYNDWLISTDNALQLYYEGDDGESNYDMPAGLSLDLSIRIPFFQNVCAVPSDIFSLPGGQSGGISPAIANQVYDLEYIADGTENKTLTLSTLAGKKVLFLSKENGVLYKVSNNPDPAEYTWNGAVITLGTAANAGDRFLFLYRNN